MKIFSRGKILITKEQLPEYDDVNPEYRCQRCWSTKDINLYPKSNFIDGNEKAFVILCERCFTEAPRGEDEKIFNNLFLRFASIKEFIKYYNVKNEAEAMECWCNEFGIERTHVIQSARIDIIEEQTIENKEEPSPFGYEMEEGRLKVNPKEIRTVQKIFKIYLSGRTMEWISRNLSREDENECSLGLETVRAILKDPIYAGYVFKGKELIRGEHDPVIDRETFNKVQQKIQRNIRNPKYRYDPLVL